MGHDPTDTVRNFQKRLDVVQLPSLFVSVVFLVTGACARCSRRPPPCGTFLLIWDAMRWETRPMGSIAPRKWTARSTCVNAPNRIPEPCDDLPHPRPADVFFLPQPSHCFNIAPRVNTGPKGQQGLGSVQGTVYHPQGVGFQIDGILFLGREKHSPMFSLSLLFHSLLLENIPFHDGPIAP